MKPESIVEQLNLMRSMRRYANLDIDRTKFGAIIIAEKLVLQNQGNVAWRILLAEVCHEAFLNAKLKKKHARNFISRTFWRIVCCFYRLLTIDVIAQISNNDESFFIEELHARRSLLCGQYEIAHEAYQLLNKNYPSRALGKDVLICVGLWESEILCSFEREPESLDCQSGVEEIGEMFVVLTHTLDIGIEYTPNTSLFWSSIFLRASFCEEWLSSRYPGGCHEECATEYLDKSEFFRKKALNIIERTTVGII